MDEPVNTSPYIDRGEPLPASYAENGVVAMVRDPEHIFAYWDVETEVRVAAWPVVLRVHCLSEGRSYDIETGVEAQSWHLGVAANRTYRLETHARTGAGELRLLATSDEVTTPVRWAGESGADAPAELLHAERHPMTSPRPKGVLPPLHSAPPSAGPVAVPIAFAEAVYSVAVRSGGM